jgi:1-acyl-sn-glycerol-3-phosphate acyltransferase
VDTLFLPRKPCGLGLFVLSCRRFVFKLKVCSGFLLFGLFILMAQPFVLLTLVPKAWLDSSSRREILHAVVHFAFSRLVRYLSLIGVIRVRLEDRRSDPRRPLRVLVANHLTLLDVVIIVATFPRCCSLVKASVARNPFLGWLIRGAGFISIDPLNPEARASAFKDMLAMVESGRTIVVFPEGTRSADGRLGPFNKGIFKALMMARTSLSPVVISVSEPFLSKGGGPAIFANSGQTVHYEILLFDDLQTPVLEQPRPRDLREFMGCVWGFFADRLDRQNASRWMRMSNSFAYAGQKVVFTEETEERVSAEYCFDETHPHFEGHFVGYPILPAVGQIDFLQAVARQWLGSPMRIVQVSRAKFLSPLVPGTTVCLTLRLQNRQPTSGSCVVEWHLMAGTQSVSRGSLALEGQRSGVSAGGGTTQW